MKRISQILNDHVEPDKFREAVAETGGDFEFDTEAMIEFGETYCSLYPESLSNSDSAGVVIGYRLVRICVVELLLKSISSDLKDYYRKMLTDVSSVSSLMDEIIGSLGSDEALRIHNVLDQAVKELKIDIDMMPSSVSKERFIGGITVFFNILYLMKKKIQS